MVQVVARVKIPALHVTHDTADIESAQLRAASQRQATRGVDPVESVVVIGKLQSHEAGRGRDIGGRAAVAGLEET
jgi:hypothetical protein